MTYGEHLKNHIDRILPKALSKFEQDKGFNLPNIRINRIEAYPSKQEWMRGNIVFGSVFVDVSVDIKDGRMGKLKSFLTNLISNAMDSLNYKYENIYLDIEQSDDLIEESIKKELRKLR
jgi:hypothetical protein